MLVSPPDCKSDASALWWFDSTPPDHYHGAMEKARRTDIALALWILGPFLLGITVALLRSI